MSEEEKLTRRQELEDVYKSMEEATPKEEPEEETEEITEEGEDDEEVSTESGDEEVTEEDGGEGDQEEGSEEESEEVEEDEAEDEAIEPLANWSSEFKEKFSELPREAQEYIVQRENERESATQEKMREAAEQRKALEPVKQIIDQWNPVFQQVGMPVETAITKLLEADYYLRNGTPDQKQQLLQQIVNDYSIPLGDEEYADPQIQALQQQVSALSGQIETKQQQDNQADLSAAQSAIETFKSSKTDDGELKYPHFDTLQGDIQMLLQSGQVGDGDYRTRLENAYEKALWLNASTRERLLNDQQSRTKQENIERQKKATVKAKKKAKANKRGVNTSASKAKKVSRRDELKEQLEAAGF